MGAFDLPQDHWFCNTCKEDWFAEYDDGETPQCPKKECKSTDVVKK